MHLKLRLGIFLGGTAIMLISFESFSQLSWSSQNSGSTTQFIDKVDFVDQNYGFTLMYPDKVVKTTNGGNTWTSQTIPGATFLTSISFVNNLTGWMLNYDYGTVYKTTNGGSTWFVQYTNPTAGIAYDLHFVDVNNGWVQRYDYTLFTHDGGLTWDSVPSPSISSVTLIQFLDTQNGYSLTAQNLFKSTDGGLSWTQLTVWPGPGYLQSFHAVDNDHIWVCGEGGLIRYSSNGGSSWVTQNTGTSVNLQDVNFYDLNNGIAVGNGGLILSTSDGGTTWVANTSGVATNVYQLDMVSAGKAWVTGESGVILNSSANTDLQTNAYVGEDTVCAGDLTPIALQVKNNGTSPITAATFSLSDLSGNLFDYNWTGNMLPGASENITIGNISDMISQTYTVAITGDAVTTNNIFSFDIEQRLAPDGTVSGPHDICEGESVTISVSGGVSYEWVTVTSTDASVLVTPTASYSTYIVKVFDGYGCYNNDTVEVYMHSPPDGVVSGPHTICEGSSVQLSVSGGASYVWPSLGQTDATVMVTPTESYSEYIVKVYDSYGCYNPDTAIVFLNMPDDGIVSGPHEYCPGDSVEISVSGGISYEWLESGETSSAITVKPTLELHEYIVITYDANSCIDHDTVIVQLSSDCDAISVAFSPNGDQKNDFLTLNNIDSNPNTVRIYSRWGDEIISFENYNNLDVVWDGTVNGETCKPGTYYYLLEIPETNTKLSGWIQIVY